jgi:hypothetical protein
MISYKVLIDALGIQTRIEFGVSVQRPDQVSLELRLAVVDGVC